MLLLSHSVIIFNDAFFTDCTKMPFAEWTKHRCWDIFIITNYWDFFLVLLTNFPPCCTMMCFHTDLLFGYFLIFMDGVLCESKGITWNHFVEMDEHACIVVDRCHYLNVRSEHRICILNQFINKCNQTKSIFRHSDTIALGYLELNILKEHIFRRLNLSSEIIG